MGNSEVGLDLGFAAVILFGMTKSSVTVSVKIPARILEHIPAPGRRSGFIVRAIKEKLEGENLAKGFRPEGFCTQ